jgi:DNA-binding winged helix-turn-helix (wHTH) protein
VLPHRRELLADGLPIKLGGRAFDVLMALIDARGEVVGKDALKAQVWRDRIVGENALQSQISALRAAFGAERDLIRTVSGRGYQFTGEIRALSGSPDEPSVAGMAAAQFAAALMPPTNVPAPVSELIGRDAEVEEVLRLAGVHRLVTLTGAGGIGKTTLALALASELRPHFAGGLWLFHIIGGRYRVALELAERFYALVTKRPDPNDRLVGDRLIGVSLFYLGALPSARRHLERVLADYVTPDHRSQINHALSTCYALALAACPIALLVGDLAAAEHYTGMLLDHSRRHALAIWHAFGLCHQGALAIKRSDLYTGLRLLRAGFDELGEAYRFLVPSAPKNAGPSRSCCASTASCFCCGADRESRRRPSITSGKRSTGRVGKAPSPGNCAPPRALPSCSAIRAVPLMRWHCSSQSTTGSPRASTPSISRSQKRSSTLSNSGCREHPHGVRAHGSN